MNNRIYTSDQIAKACAMYAENSPGAKRHSLREICVETGIKNPIVIYWHCDPAKRQLREEKNRAWIASHPDRWREITRKAALKYHRKKYATT